MQCALLYRDLRIASDNLNIGAATHAIKIAKYIAIFLLQGCLIIFYYFYQVMIFFINYFC